MTDLPALERALERQGRGGVFYLHGDDAFRKEEAVGFLVSTHLDPATADFNLDRLRGSEVDVEQLASILATPPMMAEWRVVLLWETEALASSSRARDLVVSTAEDPPPGLVLILSCTVPSGSRARFYKDLQKKARDLSFPTISENDVPAWLVARAQEIHGIEIREDAARALGAAIGTELGVLAREMEKLAGLVGEEGVIDVDAIERAGTRLPAQDRWEWIDFVGERRLEDAIRTLPTLLAQQGESGVGLVIGVATQLLRLAVVKGSGLKGLEEVLPPHQKWLVRGRGRSFRAQADAWEPEELACAVEGLLRVDRLLKSSGLSDEALVEEWLLTELARVRTRPGTSGGRAA